MIPAKDAIRRELAECLSREREVRKIVIFGSFLMENNPGDVDVAVFQDSDEGYLPLAMKYRRAARSVAKRIAIDIIPLRFGVSGDAFLAEIAKGEVIYER